MPINKNIPKLVLGALKGRKSDYQMTAKKLNIPENNIEFVDDVFEDALIQCRTVKVF